MSLGEFGRVRASLSESGRVWESLGESGRVWACLGECGRVWARLGESGRASACKGVSGRVSACLGVSASVAGLLGVLLQFVLLRRRVSPRLAAPSSIEAVRRVLVRHARTEQGYQCDQVQNLPRKGEAPGGH